MTDAVPVESVRTWPDEGDNAVVVSEFANDTITPATGLLFASTTFAFAVNGQDGLTVVLEQEVELETSAKLIFGEPPEPEPEDWKLVEPVTGVEPTAIAEAVRVAAPAVAVEIKLTVATPELFVKAVETGKVPIGLLNEKVTTVFLTGLLLASFTVACAVSDPDVGKVVVTAPEEFNNSTETLPFVVVPVPLPEPEPDDPEPLPPIGLPAEPFPPPQALTKVSSMMVASKVQKRVVKIGIKFSFILLSNSVLSGYQAGNFWLTLC